MTYAREVLDSEMFHSIVESLKDNIDHEGALTLPEWRSEDTRVLYELGFNLYRIRNFDQAETVFRKLVVVMPLEKSHWQGLASSVQMQNRHQDALVLWSMYAFIDPNSPMPHYFAAECLFAVGDYHECLIALDAASARDSKKEYEERILNLKYSCSNMLETTHA